MILVTEGESYGISPADPAKFLEALQSRYALGIARPSERSAAAAVVDVAAVARSDRSC